MNKTVLKVVALGAIGTVLGLWAISHVSFVNQLVYGKKPAA